MSNSVYGIALSGLNAARTGLTTTSNNIANVNTPGYNRQEVQISARPGNFMTGAFIGQGVSVDTVTRVYSLFIANQNVQATSEAKFFDAKSEQIARLDSVIANNASGLGTAMSEFFASAQTLTNVPSDLPSRQNFLSSAEALATRFNALNSVITDIRDATNIKVTAAVDTINGLSRQIAELNQQIVSENNKSFNNAPPNGLLDKRDELIRQMAEQIQVTRVDLNGGEVNLFLANGRPLVVQQSSFEVQAQRDPSDQENLQVGALLPDGSGNDVLVEFKPGTLGGGALSGFLEFREKELAEYQNQLGLIAAEIALNVNEIQARGVDLTDLDAGNLNTPGDPVFGFVGSTNFTNMQANLLSISQVVINANNTSGAALTLENADFSRLPPKDYEIRIDAGGTPQFRVKNSNDAFQNLTVPTAADIANGFTGDFVIRDNNPANSAMLSFSIGAGVLPNEQFTIYPTRGAARNVFVTMTDAAQIATATRNGQVAGLDPATGVTKAINPAKGDNDNALMFAELQTVRVLQQGGGSRGVTVGNSFSQLVSKVGNKTREFQIASESRNEILRQTAEVRDSFSGVNLDEEAANLLKYQQSYQAAGQVISLSKELFELILNVTQ